MNFYEIMKLVDANLETWVRPYKEHPWCQVWTRLVEAGRSDEAAEYVYLSPDGQNGNVKKPLTRQMLSMDTWEVKAAAVTITAADFEAARARADAAVPYGQWGDGRWGDALKKELGL